MKQADLRNSYNNLSGKDLCPVLGVDRTPRNPYTSPFFKATQ